MWYIFHKTNIEEGMRLGIGWYIYKVVIENLEKIKKHTGSEFLKDKKSI